ncbi:hypothetical protein [Maritimibacter dapengensis]|uniref:DoxX-like family protein n=1 Tax=Maritimibacter dapengensis TaxID=2836868 RepID=A0ABS6T6B4_9RHOB|nr:hypothetical protein [Maritimibacter dapengensis]MBV7380238.1 hypothetical protein [Maritimibacter dapengensis]
MNWVTIAGVAYLLCAAGVVAFHIAMLFGAPWGNLTMGGRFPGRYTGARKLVSLSQIAIIVALSAMVAGSAGFIGWTPPRWALWLALGISGLSVLANGATPSAPERQIWLPVTLVMFFSVLTVATMG